MKSSEQNMQSADGLF